MKATHTGTCQLCGAAQKLPGGTLSTHGYNVQWNQFFGTCPGTGYLPYEQSTDRIEAAIRNARESANELTRQATLTLQQTAVHWVRHYKAPTWTDRKGGYVWEAIAAGDIGPERTYPNPYTTCARPTRLDGKENERRAAFLIEQARGRLNYAEWQERRIAQWAPAPLQEVTK